MWGPPLRQGLLQTRHCKCLSSAYTRICAPRQTRQRQATVRPWQPVQPLRAMGNGGNGNGNGNGNHSSSSASNVFSGHSVEALQAWLETHGVQLSRWMNGSAKGVADLLEEQSKCESVLSVDASGQPLRTVRVLSIHFLNDRGQVLFEDGQILPDGRLRRRQVAVSEKLVGDECWRSAVDRAVQEELGSALPEQYEIQVLDDTYQRLEEISHSMSYPGLRTKYVFHRVNARLPGLPDGPFETREPRATGELITRWVWRDLSYVQGLDCPAIKSTDEAHTASTTTQ